MFVLKKIIRMGGSRLVALPPEWLNFVERRLMAPIDQVEIEIDDDLTIRPHLGGKKK